MQPNLIRIGVAGDLQEISAFGRKYSDVWIEGGFREERAADGTLRRDVLWRKKGIQLAYSSIDQVPLDRLNTLFNIDDELLIEITHMEQVDTYVVLMSPFGKTRDLAVWGGLWSGTSVEFLEV